MQVNLLETAGFFSSMKAMRLPHRSIGDTDGGIIGEKDLKLAQKLLIAGDEHAKALRGIIAWVYIVAPWYWFNELDTYTVGTTPMGSTSSMHTEAKGLTGDDLKRIKSALRGDYEYTRIRNFSYQTLRRIYFQRKNHRLDEWKEFCAFIETLPYAKELITYE
jgi:hypothetical protein